MPLTRPVARKNPQTGKREVVRLPYTAEQEAAIIAEQDIETTKGARQAAISRIYRHAESLITAQFGALDSWEQARPILQTLYEAMLPAARSAKMVAAIAVYQYAQTKLAEARTWDESTAAAYDPTSDPGWP